MLNYQRATLRKHMFFFLVWLKSLMKSGHGIPEMDRNGNFTGHDKLIDLPITVGSQVKKTKPLLICITQRNNKKYIDIPCFHASSNATYAHPTLRPRGPRLCMKGMDAGVPILTGRLKSVFNIPSG